MQMSKVAICACIYSSMIFGRQTVNGLVRGFILKMVWKRKKNKCQIQQTTLE